MNLDIYYQDSGTKKDTSKEIKNWISALQSVMETFLKKNHHFSGVREVSLTLTLCGKTKIRTLNKKFRSIDKVTDVLSFPVYDDLRPDQLKKLKRLEHLDLGDIVICKEKMNIQARKFKITPMEEFAHLSIHGFLHLLGFDHEISEKEDKIMSGYENELVKKVFKKIKQ